MGCDVSLLSGIEFFELLQEEDRLALANVVDSLELTAGETISIMDLRQPMNIEAFPQMIPGALRIAMEEIEERHGEISRDRDVVLYCS